MPPFLNEDTPSPLPFPSNCIDTQTTPHLSSAIVHTPAPLPLPQHNQPEQHTPNINNITCLLSLTPNLEEGATMVIPNKCATCPQATSVRSLVEETPHDSDPTGCNATQDPLNNYTNAEMPKIQDDHPTAPF